MNKFLRVRRSNREAISLIIDGIQTGYDSHFDRYWYRSFSGIYHFYVETNQVYLDTGAEYRHISEVDWEVSD